MHKLCLPTFTFDYTTAFREFKLNHEDKLVDLISIMLGHINVCFSLCASRKWVCNTGLPEENRLRSEHSDIVKERLYFLL